MSFLDRLEKRFGHLAVPNVALVLVMAQVFMYGMILIGRIDFGALLLIPSKVQDGEFWRLVSFIIAPPRVATSMFGILFLAFFWYLFWMMSGALESAWGVFRFNVYLLSGILLSVGGAFLGQWIAPGSGVILPPDFLYLSVFFAFATIHPNFEFMMFFVLPVKVKWLAIFAGALTLGACIFAPNMGYRLAIIAPVLNYFLFFRGALFQSLKSRQRRARFEAQRHSQASEALHVCALCGATDQAHPEREFRYRTANGEAECICNVCRSNETT